MRVASYGDWSGACAVMQSAYRVKQLRHTAYLEGNDLQSCHYTIKYCRLNAESAVDYRLFDLSTVATHLSLQSLVRHSSRYVFNIKITLRKKVEETVKKQISEVGSTHTNDLHLKHFPNLCCLTCHESMQCTPPTHFLGAREWKH